MTTKAPEKTHRRTVKKSAKTGKISRSEAKKAVKKVLQKRSPK